VRDALVLKVRHDTEVKAIMIVTLSHNFSFTPTIDIHNQSSQPFSRLSPQRLQQQFDDAVT
jgi:hypothetical protein